ncbi:MULTISPECIES: hypothetical protein [unclassified Roseovarius]|uniref:head-tail connector protein n=1 Tax=unclassified Roseovarius TaxID=2614913 RepID=UPI00273D7369|nr:MULTISPECIES: hypothetical protein [unclassified Roseovarius]
MKMVVNRFPSSSAAPFLLQDVQTHLRADDDEELSAVDTMARAAAHEIEQFAQIALLTQTIRVKIFDPTQDCGIRLPIGPADEENPPTVSIDGETFTAFDFAGGIRPYIHWNSSFQNLTPRLILIEYQAGFGSTASQIPSDLAQAIMDQAALHYDGRSPMDAKSLTTSPHMVRIGARYRGVQA